MGACCNKAPWTKWLINSRIDCSQWRLGSWGQAPAYWVFEGACFLVHRCPSWSPRRRNGRGLLCVISEGGFSVSSQSSGLLLNFPFPKACLLVGHLGARRLSIRNLGDTDQSYVGASVIFSCGCLNSTCSLMNYLDCFKWQHTDTCGVRWT